MVVIDGSELRNKRPSLDAWTGRFIEVKEPKLDKKNCPVDSSAGKEKAVIKFGPEKFKYCNVFSTGIDTVVSEVTPTV